MGKEGRAGKSTAGGSEPSPAPFGRRVNPQRKPRRPQTSGLALARCPLPLVLSPRVLIVAAFLGPTGPREK